MEPEPAPMGKISFRILAQRNLDTHFTAPNRGTCVKKSHMKQWTGDKIFAERFVASIMK